MNQCLSPGTQYFPDAHFFAAVGRTSSGQVHKVDAGEEQGHQANGHEYLHLPEITGRAQAVACLMLVHVDFG